MVKLALISLMTMPFGAIQKQWIPYISWLRPKEALSVTARGWVTRYKMPHFAIISQKWEGNMQTPNPEIPEATIDSNILSVKVYVSPSGTKYHRYWCRYVGIGLSEITLLQAIIDNKEPCLVCKPEKIGD